jgi:hypothetical protein
MTGKGVTMTSLSDFEPAGQQYPGWNELLLQAVMRPGKLHDGYQAFWRYSVGNQQLALSQCLLRRIEIGPIASYNTWKDRGRVVRKGEHGIVMCMPLPIYKTRDGQPLPEGEDPYMIFKYMARWFVFAQTDPLPGWQGLPWEEEALPDWDRARALTALDVTEESFSDLNGNVQGYSLPDKKLLAINPMAQFPYKTTFHELAHILLGHNHDMEHRVGEVEAEAVAYICANVLQVDLDGLESARAYIQSYLGAYLLDDKLAQRVFRVANKVIEAGHPEKVKHEKATGDSEPGARAQSARNSKRPGNVRSKRGRSGGSWRGKRAS